MTSATDGDTLAAIAVRYNAATRTVYAAIVNVEHARRHPYDIDRTTHLWECEHRHRTPANAIRCARDELGRWTK